ncbi:acyltransferase family protein [Colwellia polaris]|uniref:acyltransferase family protein n=1 Tax=Colwellia polaris TaxID=326537 RepID=UPI000A1736AE|nr:acyltransferase family protein [Colwellia polaris]
MSFKYRSDIDGLRAIAVLLVIFYHAGFKVISGGFIGVDVFFVISGFLITSIIQKEILNKEFKLFNFYIKRIRRILPAFYVVIFTTIFCGFFILLPSDFTLLAKSFLASSIFIANMYFWKATGGYFNSNTDELPLLHIWSLSLEEQFYFIWPFFLILVLGAKFKKIIIPLLSVVVILLFAFSEWAAITKPNAAYYFLPTRAGELLIGGLLAILVSSGVKLKQFVAQLCSIFGVVLLVYSAFILSKSSVFPGINSLLPCLGAVLIILSGTENSTFVGRMLSTKLLVFIGLISYPMYLWHWPIIAYLNYLNYELDYIVGSSVILITIILAIFTWHFIEGTLKKIKLKNSTVFINMFAIPTLIVICIAYMIVNNDGYENRFSSNNKYLDIKSALVMPTVSEGWCYQAELPKNIDKALNCTLGVKEGKSNAIFVGDSHAGHYQYLVNSIGQKTDLKIKTMITSNCFPSLYTKDSSNLGGNPKLCMAFRSELSEYSANEDLSIVFFAARWDANSEWLFETKEALDTLTNRAKKIIIFPQVPNYKNNVSQEYLRAMALPIFNRNYINKIDNTYASANKKVKILADKYENVTFVDIKSFTEKEELLPLFNLENIPYYFDDNHLNMQGSEMLTNAFMGSTEGQMLIDSIIKK